MQTVPLFNCVSIFFSPLCSVQIMSWTFDASTSGDLFFLKVRMFVCMRSKLWSNYKSNSTWMSKPGCCSMNKNQSAHSTLDTLPHKFAKINCWHISAKAILHQYCSNTYWLSGPAGFAATYFQHILLSLSLRVYYRYTGNRDSFIDSTSMAHLIFFFPLPLSWVSNYQPQLNSHTMKPMKYDSAPARGN